MSFQSKCRNCKVPCRWCGRIAPLRKGRLQPHLTYGGQKCVGVGQPVRA